MSIEYWRCSIKPTLNGDTCLVCGITHGLEYHHTFYGDKYNRAFTDKYNLGFYLCSEHHRGDYSPHMNRELDLKLKRIAQTKFEEAHSREDFMGSCVGRNYL